MANNVPKWEDSEPIENESPKWEDSTPIEMESTAEPSKFQLAAESAKDVILDQPFLGPVPNPAYLGKQVMAAGEQIERTTGGPTRAALAAGMNALEQAPPEDVSLGTFVEPMPGAFADKFRAAIEEQPPPRELTEALGLPENVASDVLVSALFDVSNFIPVGSLLKGSRWLYSKSPAMAQQLMKRVVGAPASIYKGAGSMALDKGGKLGYYLTGSGMTEDALKTYNKLPLTSSGYLKGQDVLERGLTQSDILMSSSESGKYAANPYKGGPSLRTKIGQATGKKAEDLLRTGGSEQSILSPLIRNKQVSEDLDLMRKAISGGDIDVAAQVEKFIGSLENSPVHVNDLEISKMLQQIRDLKFTARGSEKMVVPKEFYRPLDRIRDSLIEDLWKINPEYAQLRQNYAILSDMFDSRKGLSGIFEAGKWLGVGSASLASATTGNLPAAAGIVGLGIMSSSPKSYFATLSAAKALKAPEFVAALTAHTADEALMWAVKNPDKFSRISRAVFQATKESYIVPNLDGGLREQAKTYIDDTYASVEDRAFYTNELYKNNALPPGF